MSGEYSGVIHIVFECTVDVYAINASEFVCAMCILYYTYVCKLKQCRLEKQLIHRLHSSFSFGMFCSAHFLSSFFLSCSVPQSVFFLYFFLFPFNLCIGAVEYFQKNICFLQYNSSTSIVLGFVVGIDVMPHSSTGAISM